MANKEVKNQKTQTTEVANNSDMLDSSFENLKKGNLISENVNQKALEEIAKSREAELTSKAKRAICEAEYNNLKTVIVLRDQRRCARVAKKLATDSKALLDSLVGTTNEKGEFTPGTLTPVEYEKKRDEMNEAANKELRESTRLFNEEIKELNARFPDYWRYECGWDKVQFNINNRNY